MARHRGRRRGCPNKAKLSTENAGKGVFTDDLMKVEDINERLLHPVPHQQV